MTRPIEDGNHVARLRSWLDEDHQPHWGQHEADLSAVLDEVAHLRAENGRLQEALVTTTVHLIGAKSMVERIAKDAAPSDKMFRLILDDYQKAIDTGRDALGFKDPAGGDEG